MVASKVSILGNHFLHNISSAEVFAWMRNNEVQDKIFQNHMMLNEQAHSLWYGNEAVCTEKHVSVNKGIMLFNAVNK